MIVENLESLRISDKINVTCDECAKSFSRAKGQILLSRKNHSGLDRCQSCSQRITNKRRDPAHQKKMVDAAANFCRGKTLEEICGLEHATRVKARHSACVTGEKNPNFGGKYTRGFKDNPPTGKWENRYGAEKSQSMRDNLSRKTSGENNPMFGISPSIKSSRGIRGWIDDKFFFSSYELRFMLDCIKNGQNFEAITGSNVYRIEYIFKGKRRTYCPDFLVGVQIIEIKPKKFQSFEINRVKIEAALKQFGANYVLLDEHLLPPLPKKDELDTLIETGRLRFINGDYSRLIR